MCQIEIGAFYLLIKSPPNNRRELTKIERGGCDQTTMPAYKNICPILRTHFDEWYRVCRKYKS